MDAIRDARSISARIARRRATIGRASPNLYGTYDPNDHPDFRFMSVDWDGKIRMDCSSPYAMAGLIALKDKYDLAFACDTDHDRHGIVTRSAGLMNPNHYLTAAISYLFSNRPGWRADAGVGKTLVSSSMIDRVAAHLGRGGGTCRSASSGLWTDFSTARSVSAAKRAPAPPSFGETDRRGLPTRTASLWGCWPRR
jgi:hypothetical protein